MSAKYQPTIRLTVKSMLNTVAESISAVLAKLESNLHENDIIWALWRFKSPKLWDSSQRAASTESVSVSWGHHTREIHMYSTTRLQGFLTATWTQTFDLDNTSHLHGQLSTKYKPISPNEYELSDTWWRHQMETFSAVLAICAGNSPVTGEFLSQRPVTQSSDIFVAMRMKKQLSKQSHWLWGHCNGYPLRVGGGGWWWVCCVCLWWGGGWGATASPGLKNWKAGDGDDGIV